ncbi:MAG: hypothetical protein QM831_01660 [Kofleriaceae bacterium]
MAHLPAHLPRSEADLADWSVYADELLREGDPLGELIALDLSLPRPDEAFRSLAAQHCWNMRDGLDASWTLGFIRELTLSSDQMPRIVPDENTFDRVRNLFVDRIGSRMDTLMIPLGGGSGVRPTVARILPALPATCRTVFVTVWGTGPIDLVPIVDALPETVREFVVLTTQLAHIDAVISDRFDQVRLMFVGGMPWAAIEAALARTSRVVLRLHDAQRDRFGNRVVTVADTGFVTTSHHIWSCNDHSQLYLQRVHGVTPARAQLHHTLAELHEVMPRVKLTRIGDRWTRDGEALNDGQVVRVGAEQAMFCTHDLVARAKAM